MIKNRRGKFLPGPHTARQPKMYLWQILTRDFFAVANIVVLPWS